MNKFSSISTSVLVKLVIDYKYGDEIAGEKESAQFIMESLDSNLEEVNAELLYRGYYDD